MISFAEDLLEANWQRSQVGGLHNTAMDDASSGSDDGHSRGNEWEVVTRSLSSHSLSASTSFGTGA